MFEAAGMSILAEKSSSAADIVATGAGVGELVGAEGLVDRRFGVGVVERVGKTVAVVELVGRTVAVVERVGRTVVVEGLVGRTGTEVEVLELLEQVPEQAGGAVVEERDVVEGVHRKS